MSVPAQQQLARGRYAALALRGGLGVVFVAHALVKVLVYSMPGTAQFFEAHGFPGWTAYPVALAELIGGALLIVGLHTRAVALGLVPILLGALTVHWTNGWSFDAPGGGWEYVAFLIVALGVQALLGDGAWALSARRHRRIDPAHGLGGVADPRLSTGG